MYIKKLNLYNFKSFSEKTFEFGDENYLIGANGVGKSSTIEAIIFAYYGRLPDGGTEIKKLLKNGADKAIVSLYDSRYGNIVRTISKSGSVKLTLEGSEMSQNNFAQVCKLPPLEYFLASANPEYWIALDYKERRQIMVELSPTISRSEVFKELYGEELVDRFEITTYQEVNKEIKDYELNIENTRGRLQQIQISVPEKPAEYDDKKYQDLIDKKNHILEIEKTYLSRKSDVSVISAKLEMIEEQKSKLPELEESKNNLINKFRSLKEFGIEEVRKILVQKDSISKKFAEFSIEANQHNKNLNELSKIEVHGSGKCPVCSSEIDSKSISQRRSEESRQVQALKIKIEKYKMNLDKITSLEDDYRKYQSQYQSLEKEIEAINKINVKEEELKTQLASAQKLLDNAESVFNKNIWNEEDEQELKNLIDIKAKHEAYVEIATKQNEQNKKNIDLLNKQIESMEGEMNKLKILQTALSPKGVYSEIVRRQTNYFIEKVSKYGSDIKVETTEPLVTKPDELKEVFNIFWNGKQENRLSTGQKMTLAVYFCYAIQDLIAEKLEFDISLLFLDNSSLITQTSEFNSIRKVQAFYAINDYNSELEVAFERTPNLQEKVTA